MKLLRLLPLLAIPIIWFLLDRFLPSEAEREAQKNKYLAERNSLEKQLVGKWNHNDIPAGMDNNRNYHLLSADASYTYRGSDKSKTFGKNWSANPNDSILLLNNGSPDKNIPYKILNISPSQISLQKINDDGSRSAPFQWHRHP